VEARIAARQETGETPSGRADAPRTVIGARPAQWGILMTSRGSG